MGHTLLLFIFVFSSSFCFAKTNYDYWDLKNCKRIVNLQSDISLPKTIDPKFIKSYKCQYDIGCEYKKEKIKLRIRCNMGVALHRDNGQDTLFCSKLQSTFSGDDFLLANNTINDERACAVTELSTTSDNVSCEWDTRRRGRRLHSGPSCNRKTDFCVGAVVCKQADGKIKSKIAICSADKCQDDTATKCYLDTNYSARTP